MEERIRRVMATTFGLELTDIPATASQATVEKWDSLGHIHLILALESEFGVQFSAAQIPQLVDLRAIERALQAGRQAA